MVSYAMIQWTEILPKTLGAHFNRQLAPLIVVPLQWLIRLLWPIVWFIHLLNRPFEASGKTSGPTTAEEIHALAQSALLSKQLAPQQVKIISAGAGLAGKTARQIMVPLEEISFLDADMFLPDAFVKAHLDSHTRYPLRENNDLNKIIGYVNLKELAAVLRTNAGNPTLRGIARPLLFVSPDDPCSSIIKLLVEGHCHIAIVKDVIGKTIGLLTMEDVVEELVGDIEDEFDHLPRTFHSLGETVYSIGGGFSMAELAQKLRVEIPDAGGSMSDWITARLGHSPQPNEAARLGDWKFTVRRIRRQRAYEVMAVKEASVDSSKV